jgi:hypothetical protein
VSDRIWNELRLERGEVLQEECRQETIFIEREQVLLVQRVYVPFGVLVDDTVQNDDRPAFVCRLSYTQSVARLGDGEWMMSIHTYMKAGIHFNKCCGKKEGKKLPLAAARQC